MLFWPILLSYSRQYNLEMGLVATAAGANYFLLASDGFARRPATLAFGLLCGLGLLAKITFPVFIARSLIVVLAQHRRDFDARRGLWLAGALVLAAAVAAFWYLPRLEHIGRALLLHVVGYNREFGPGQAESGAPLLVDAAGKWGPVGVVYFLAALAAYPLFRDRKWLPVWVWMLVPIFVFVIAPSDIVRFALAATPAMAVLAVVFARRVLRGRKVLTVLVIVAWGGLAAASTILASQQMWRLPNASADSARILRAVDSPAPRVCYVQHSADTDFNEEHLRFLLRLHEPRLAFAPFGPGTFHIQHYERLVDCFRRGGAVLFRGGEHDLAWPSRAVLRDIVVGADKHALRQDQGLAKGLFPPDFTFADWPDTPPDGYEKADGIGYRVEDGPPIEFTLFAPRGD
ncbi:MAG: hypothetical protein P9L99_06890 [Candidatus Lernaella stagnicola]|nr:hypothetical protein [Candidatus Lernaella stagnicola]